jgi:glutamate synthase domain-containing protein 2
MSAILERPAGGAEPPVRGTPVRIPTPVPARAPVSVTSTDPAERPGSFHRQIAMWEDLLTLVVEPDSETVRDRERGRRMLSYLLERAGVEESRFWRLARGRRSRLFLSHFSRVSRELPKLEITAFDLDKALKERYRHEPLTIGAAWHHGFWRSYFSHAAITHPANDGLREEFSTAWDIARRYPAVLFRTAAGRTHQALRTIRLDMPMIVGPLPMAVDIVLERAYLEAIAAANPAADLHTRSLVVIEADRCVEHTLALRPHAAHVMPRLEPRHLEQLASGSGASGVLRDWVAAARIVEIAWSPNLARDVAVLVGIDSSVLVSVFMRYEESNREFWPAVEATARLDGVAMLHVHSGREKSYRLVPRVDAFLKARFLRARVQLVSAGGDTDTQASAATVYEAVLLGANGGAMTHIAEIALLPELIEVHHGAELEVAHTALRGVGLPELRELAVNTLTCWQHSILDFLSCMGIDDIQKTSGNTMAITMTEDWIREVDALATPEFGRTNAGLNVARIAAEPVPSAIRERFKVSSLLGERRPDLPLVAAAKILAHENANFHLENTNRNLSADFLEVIYRMAAGQMPEPGDFLIDSDMGAMSLDSVGLELSRASIEWSLARLARDPQLLDYVSLAVPRGFQRPGAVASAAMVELRARADGPALHAFTADLQGGFEVRLPAEHAVENAVAGNDSLWLVARDAEGAERTTELSSRHGGHGQTIARGSSDGLVTLRREPRGGTVLSGFGFREPIWHGPVCHASISLGAASEDFLIARIEGNTGLTMTSSGEGGPIRLAPEAMAWESMQAASGHFGMHAADLRRVRDVEIKINQGAKPGKGGRLSGAKVTTTVSKARNIPVGTDALSPDPKHDIYSIEDMPAEVWLWLLYHNHCGIKITGSNYTRYVAAGMWSNFVVDYLLVDSGLGGSGNYHADSSHVGWPDIFRTILHTHHALVGEKVDLAGTGELKPIRDLNGAPFGAGGGTRLLASGGLRGELDMIKVLIAGADALVEASIGKAVAFGCNQCGNCHLDCPRGGITTKPELTMQNDRALMRTRFRNWTVMNLVKLAVMIDALNRESGALDAQGRVVDADRLLDDIRKLRGRTDLLQMPRHTGAAGTLRSLEPVVDGVPLRAAKTAPPADPFTVERDSCRVGSLAVSEPVTVHAIWESARLSFNGGNNRGGGIDFAGFAPAPVREKTCVIINTIGPDRAETIRQMVGHFQGCTFFDADGAELALDRVIARLPEFMVPVRDRYQKEDGWRLAELRENPGDFHVLFVELNRDVLERYGRLLLASEHWLQRRTLYGDLSDFALAHALEHPEKPAPAGDPNLERLDRFIADVREEYFTALAHLLDSRYYRTHAPAGSTPPAAKYAAKRRGFVVSMGEDVGAIKISGWTHTIPEYFDFDRFWAGYPGAKGGLQVTLCGKTFRTPALHAHVWGMHHRYPTNSPAIDAEGRGNPAGAHPFKAYNVLLMHNGEQVAVDSTAPFLMEFGYVHADPSFGEGYADYHGDSVYERKALTDTEYAAYLVDFTRRVLGLSTEEASQIISPITGFDLINMDAERRKKFELLMTNYVQLTPTGPYKFTIVESRRRWTDSGPVRVVGFRENMDIKFLRPHEIVVSRDTTPGGVHAVANGSEAKIADSMLRTLHAQGVLADAGHDLRFNMRPGGTPQRRDFGGVFEAFTAPGSQTMDLRNRFGEPIEVERGGSKVDLEVLLDQAVGRASSEWKTQVLRWLEAMTTEVHAVESGDAPAARVWGPDDELTTAARELVAGTLDRLRTLTFEDYRYLVEHALPEWANGSDLSTALTLRVLAALRTRLSLTDLGGKSLSSMEYLTDGGRAGDRSAEGGIVRLLDQVAPIHEALASPAPTGRWARLTLDTRDDLSAPADPLRDVLVVDYAGFKSESFWLDSASRITSEAVRLGWRNFVAYGFIGGPRYVGTNLATADGLAARGVTIEMYGREFGDFIGALLESARIYVFGQGQSHLGFKTDSGYLFVLQDSLNTCMYAAHGGTINVWDSGSRFAVAGQNKVTLEDGRTPAPGFKSIHFGSPNEYAFEYLMAGGDNSLHVVMGLRKPDERGELSLKPRPYSGKFFMSGAAAGRVFVFDPLVRLDPAQYSGNVLSAISSEEWARDLGPFVAAEAARRGLPIRIEGDYVTIRLEGAWRRWRFEEAFAKIVPVKVAKAAQQQGISPPALVQIVAE